MLEFLVQLIPIVMFAAAAVAIIVWRNHVRKQREAAMAAMALGRGWSYRAVNRQLWRKYREFPGFNQGSSRIARHIMRGTHEGMTFVLFQYQYTVSHGKTSTTYTVPTLCATMPVSAPHLSIEPENLGHKLFDALGGEDIDFESDAFSRKFWVRCRDRRFAYDVINPRMMDYLTWDGGTWHWIGNRLVVKGQGTIDEAIIHRLLARAKGFIHNLPRHLLHE